MSLTEAPDPQPAIPSASIATYLASREATGRWVLDPANSTVEFHTRSMWGLAKVHGRFTTVTGAGTVEADGAVTGELTIDAGSLDTKIKKRDEHLRSAAFFDVEQNPTLTYQVLAITAAGTERVEVTGLLTVRNHREPVTFVATVSEAGPTTVSLNAELTVDRSRFGMSWSPMRMAPMNTRIVVQARFRRGH